MEDAEDDDLLKVGWIICMGTGSASGTDVDDADASADAAWFISAMAEMSSVLAAGAGAGAGVSACKAVTRSAVVIAGAGIWLPTGAGDSGDAAGDALKPLVVL